MDNLLPTIDIDPDKIKSLKESKKVINQLLNTFEKLALIVQQLVNENKRLKEEMDRLNKQSKKPFFNKKQKLTNYSFSKKFKPALRQRGKTGKRKNIVVDKEEVLSEAKVCPCGCNQFKTIRTWKKVVQGIEIKRNNTRYLGKDKKCLNCGMVLKSTIPKTIKGKQFDNCLTTWVSILKHDCRFSEELIHKFLTALGIIISKGQINNILLDNSQKLKDSYLQIKSKAIKKAAYLHSDATGSKRKNKQGEIINQHLHFLGHQFVSLFKITRKYNSNVLNKKVLSQRVKNKFYLSDDAGANKQVDVKAIQLCWIHEIRHYLKLDPWIEIHKKRLEKTIGQLWNLYHLSKDYNQYPTGNKRDFLVRQFNFIVNQKTGYDKLDKRLLLTKRKKDKLLLFTNYPGLPIQNNLAERDLRPAVIIRKLTGGTKSKKGDRSLERHLSIIQTAKKQGLNVFDTLYGLLTNQLDPCVLTTKTTPCLKRVY